MKCGQCHKAWDKHERRDGFKLCPQRKPRKRDYTLPTNVKKAKAQWRRASRVMLAMHDDQHADWVFRIVEAQT
jgi:hypothetical protein